MQRRQFIQGASASGVMSLSGCFFLGLALRLVARRGFVRGGARASRRSQRGQLESMGRAGALTAYRLLRTGGQISRLQRVGQLVREDNQQVVSEMEGNSDVVLSKMERTVVCETRIGSRGRMQHHSPFYNTFLGYSYDEGDTRGIVHTDHKQNFLSRDIVRDDRILHLDQSDRKLGETLVNVDGVGSSEATLRVVDSKHLEREFEKAETPFSPEDRTLARRMAELEDLNRQCQARTATQSCDDLNARIEQALRNLERSL